MTKASQIFYGGQILTLDSRCSCVEALAEKDGYILAVGSKGELAGLRGPHTRMVNIQGAVMLPGFFDAHSHFLRAGLYGMYHVDLRAKPIGTVTCAADILHQLRQAASRVPTGQWIPAYGYDDTALKEQRHLTRQELDSISTEHPLYVRHVSGHLAIANSTALALAGIDDNTLNPPGGVFCRDEQGQLTGMVEEGSAMSILLAPVPETTQEEWRRSLEWSTAAYTSKGVTTAQDGGVTTPIWEALWDGYEQGLLKNRLQMLPRLGDMDIARIPTSTAGTALTPDRMLSLGAIKLFHDGSLQGYTGYLSNPYHTLLHPRPEGHLWRGYPTLDRHQLQESVRHFHRQGWQVAVHGNGDAAIQDIIDAFEAAQQDYPRHDARHIIMHCQTVREDQLDRIQRLGIVPSFFTVHVYYWGDRHRDIFLGPCRAARLNPLYSALTRDIPFTMHNDTFVTPIDPLRSVWTAVNRLTSSGFCLGKEQRIPVLAALRSVTTWAARQFHEEKYKGSLEPGKLADMVLLGANPFSSSPESLCDIPVLATIVHGKCVFGTL